MSQVRSDFLKVLKDKKTQVSVYLSNGIKLQGFIQDYDDTVIILGRDGTTQMIERTATSTVVPSI